MWRRESSDRFRYLAWGCWFKYLKPLAVAGYVVVERVLATEWDAHHAADPYYHYVVVSAKRRRCDNSRAGKTMTCLAVCALHMVARVSGDGRTRS